MSTRHSPTGGGHSAGIQSYEIRLEGRLEYRKELVDGLKKRNDLSSVMIMRMPNGKVRLFGARPGTSLDLLASSETSP